MESLRGFRSVPLERGIFRLVEAEEALRNPGGTCHGGCPQLRACWPGLFVLALPRECGPARVSQVLWHPRQPHVVPSRPTAAGSSLKMGTFPLPRLQRGSSSWEAPGSHMGLAQ